MEYRFFQDKDNESTIIRVGYEDKKTKTVEWWNYKDKEFVSSDRAYNILMDAENTREIDGKTAEKEIDKYTE